MASNRGDVKINPTQQVSASWIPGLANSNKPLILQGSTEEHRGPVIFNGHTTVRNDLGTFNLNPPKTRVICRKVHQPHLFFLMVWVFSCGVVCVYVVWYCMSGVWYVWCVSGVCDVHVVYLVCVWYMWCVGVCMCYVVCVCVCV